MSQTAEPRKWDFSTGALPYRDQLFKSALRMTRTEQLEAAVAWINDV